MLTFTGCEYLLIDCANNYGMDKEIFQDRIDWAKKNLDKLESLIPSADEPVMFAKSVIAIRCVQRGEATGHLVELDATTSGIQIMSAITGCLQGATWTNLIDPDHRYDCYTEVFKAMLVTLNNISCPITREQAKNAIMCAFYGSEAEPKKELGEDTDELEAFYHVCQTKLPGAWELRCDLIELWQPYTLSYSCTMPDGYEMFIKVMHKSVKGCEIDELDHHKFTHTFYTNEGKEKGLFLAAHVIHGLDGYLVRESGRRSNYNPEELRNFASSAKLYLVMNNIPLKQPTNKDIPVSLRYIDTPLHEIEFDYILRMLEIIERVLGHNSFETLYIHDAYKSHPNNANIVRYWYKELLAELAESDVMSDIFSQISGRREVYLPVKGGLSKTEMARRIRASNYAIC
jgi:hypothetical protein